MDVIAAMATPSATLLVMIVALGVSPYGVAGPLLALGSAFLGAGLLLVGTAQS